MPTSAQCLESESTVLLGPPDPAVQPIRAQLPASVRVMIMTLMAVNLLLSELVESLRLDRLRAWMIQAVGPRAGSHKCTDLG